LSAGSSSSSSSLPLSLAAAAVKVLAGSATAALSGGHPYSALSSPAATLAVIIAATSSAVDLSTMAVAQRSCPSKPSLHGTSLQLHVISWAQGHILCDISRGIIRPVVPEQHCHAIFNSIHTISQPGTRATRCLIL
jgi:hypothetical protein